MEGLLFPIIMLTVTLVGGGLLLLVLKNAKPKRSTNEQRASVADTIAMQTAQSFINVKDVKDKYRYTKDGLVLTFLRVHSISIDLYSKAEKNSLIKQLTAELSDIQYPFKFMAVSRPVDISPLISDMQAMLKTADDKRKELLRQEILQMSSYALSGEIVERQFYISLWEKSEDGAEKDLLKRASLLAISKDSPLTMLCDSSHNNCPLVGMPVAFSLDSKESNSMKSSNPHSGCRETDLARTIDTTNPCPSKGHYP